MVLNDMKNFKDLTDSEIASKITEFSTELVNLRVKKATRQSFPPKEFKHTRKKLAQLLTIQKSRSLKIDNVVSKLD
jgi:large subunit ribosomal protein L29|nr:ribosomal protein L29 [Meringosphaera mediterranea]